MKTLEFIFKTFDNVEIQVYQWFPDNQDTLKGIVQISHGMAEHAGRYVEFAEFLVSNHYGFNC